ncbi:hypothetical protein ACJX0J_036349, partial [Zea mays]
MGQLDNDNLKLYLVIFIKYLHRDFQMNFHVLVIAMHVSLALHLSDVLWKEREWKKEHDEKNNHYLLILLSQDSDCTFPHPLHMIYLVVYLTAKISHKDRGLHCHKCQYNL